MTPEQRAVIRKVLAVAKRKGASPRERKAAVQTILVESNARHLDYGDRDSVGAFQQRPSQGWGPAGESVETDAGQFFDAAKRANTGRGSAGQLAQRVQRSAFPDRYDQRSKDAEAILGKDGGKGNRVARAMTPGVDRSDERKRLLASYLLDRNDPGSLLKYGRKFQEAKDTPSVRAKTATGSAPSPKVGRASIDSLASLAKSYGLSAGEHSKHGGVAPVHTKGSYHYKDKALDISGPPDKLAAFHREVRLRYGKGLAELIYKGPGRKAGNLKHGKVVGPGFYSGHERHVHVAVK